MRIGITANPHIPSALDSAKHVVARLEPAQEVVLESDLARAFGRNGMPLAHMKTEVVLAIGGGGPDPPPPPPPPFKGPRVNPGAPRGPPPSHPGAGGAIHR